MPVGIVSFNSSASSEGVSEGYVGADALGAVGPLQGERNRTEETIVGIAQARSGVELVATNDARPKRIGAI